MFRALISGTIESFKKNLGKMAGIIMEAIDSRIEEFFCAVTPAKNGIQVTAENGRI